MYDQGYQDGLDKSKSALYYTASSTYKQGFDDGESILWYFDKGCEDKVSGYYPQYPNIPKYMEGYDLCDQ